MIKNSPQTKVDTSKIIQCKKYAEDENYRCSKILIDYFFLSLL